MQLARSTPLRLVDEFCRVARKYLDEGQFVDGVFHGNRSRPNWTSAAAEPLPPTERDRAQARQF
jgi:hypothetical protein